MKITLLALSTSAAVSLMHPALAHPGLPDMSAGFYVGLLHPLTGIDHLMAMLIVGMWGVQIGGRAPWAVPLTFWIMMVAGAVLALDGVSPPHIETGIIVSLLVLGLLVTGPWRVPTGIAALLTGVFALFHGAEHGHEALAALSPIVYELGFLTMTALLHLTGIAFGFWAQERKAIPAKAFGALTVATGIAIALM